MLHGSLALLWCAILLSRDVLYRTFCIVHWPTFPQATLLGLAPVTGGIVRTYGTRNIALAGGAIITIGMAVSSQVTALWQLYLTLGLVTGVGFSFAYVPAIVVVSQYWVARRSLATGIAVAGSGTGTLIMTGVTEALLAGMSWRSALWMTAVGAGVVTLGSGALFVAPTVAEGGDKQEGVEEEGGEVSAAAPGGEESGGEEEEGDVGVDGGDVELVEGAVAPAVEGDAVLEGGGDVEVGAGVSLEVGSDASHASSRSVMEDADTQDMHSAPSDTATPHVAAADSVLSRLVANPAFIALICAGVPTSFGYLTPYTHLKRFMVSDELGFSVADAATALVIIGAMSLVGRVGMGQVSDRSMFGKPPHVVRMWLFLLCGLGTALSVLGMAAVFDLAGMLVSVAAFGIFSGGILSIMPVVVADVIGLADLPIGLGLMYMVQVPGFLFGPATAGFVRVAAGSYIPAFAMAGAVLVAGGIPLLLLVRDESPPHDAVAAEEEAKAPPSLPSDVEDAAEPLAAAIVAPPAALESTDAQPASDDSTGGDADTPPSPEAASEAQV